MRAIATKMLDCLAKAFKKKNEPVFFYVNTDTLERDRLEIHLRNGRPLGGIS